MTAEAAHPISDADLSSRVYRRYALGLLTVIYAFSMLDRQIVTILAEPMKAEMHLADWQLGVISGLSFALFYTFLGLPIARFADRGDRSAIIAISLALWSAFTMLCGLAQSFSLLLLARIGVGVGEAGGTPPSHSLITEFTPRERRASALATFSLGIPLGSLAGLTMGGLVADAYGWRMGFILAGAPGVVLALIAAATLREPRRGRKAVAVQAQQPVRAVLAELAGKPAFIWVSLGAAFASFAFNGQTAFYGSLFLRTHAAEIKALADTLSLGPGGFVGLALGLTIGLLAGAGTILGGLLADRFGRGDIAVYVRMPGIALLAAAPFFAGLALSTSAVLALGLLAVSVAAYAMIYGPAFAAVQTLVRPQSRATAAAVMLFLANLIGLGLGPVCIGLLSDALTEGLGPVWGLRSAVASCAVVVGVAGVCFLMALRTVRQDEHIATEAEGAP